MSVLLIIIYHILVASVLIESFYLLINMEEVIDGDSDLEAVLHPVVKTRKRKVDKSN